MDMSVIRERIAEAESDLDMVVRQVQRMSDERDAAIRRAKSAEEKIDRLRVNAEMSNAAMSQAGDRLEELRAERDAAILALDDARQCCNSLRGELDQARRPGNRGANMNRDISRTPLVG